MSNSNVKKIVLTGGPGGGKTTALDLFRREIKDVAIVPEAATLLFQNGILHPMNTDELKRTQLSIYYMQKNLEKIYRNQFPDKSLVCDRGCLDSLAYWPENNESFLKEVNSSFEEQLNRYDAVIFFESAACSGEDIQSNNPYRLEDKKQAIALNNKLKEIWKSHPKFYFVGSESSFIDKISFGVKTIKSVLRS